MKKQSAISKTIIVAIIALVLGYLGLDISKETIGNTVDEYVIPVATKTEAPEASGVQTYVVATVIDGDTLVVRRGGEDQTIRVIGIDTPETKHSRQGAECYGVEASARAVELLTGATVTVTTDESQGLTDAYDRVLGYVTLPDGQDFGAVMVAEGYAKEFTFNQPYQKQSIYRAAETSARSGGLGLWSCAEA